MIPPPPPPHTHVRGLSSRAHIRLPLKHLALCTISIFNLSNLRLLLVSLTTFLILACGSEHDHDHAINSYTGTNSDKVLISESEFASVAVMPQFRTVSGS